MSNKKEIATKLYKRVRREQLEKMKEKMPSDVQGVEFKQNGITYVAFIRRLAPAECDRLQTIPEWYDWGGISETQHLKMDGNGWNVVTIKHCWSFLPDFGRPIRVWSLFDGMACGHIVLSELNIPIECYVSSEVDKHAIKAEKQNFPDIVQVGSVMDIDVAELVGKYGVPDFIFGGSPCFASGTKILTKEGYKNIEDVVVGDEVLTHMNRYRRVLKVGNKVADTFALKAQGFLNTICTANHPFYARKKNSVLYMQENGKHSYHLTFGEPEWIEAKELPQNYYICNNIEKQECANPLSITEEEAWVIGRYIADGHTRKDRRYDRKPNGDKWHNGSRAWQLILSIGNGKVEHFCSHFKELHYSCYKHGESVHHVVFSNKRLVEIVENQCGSGSMNKHFGEMLIRLPKSLLEIVLKSYIEGDGCFSNGAYSVTTTSETLGLSLQRVLSKLYNRHISITTHKPQEYRELCGRVVHQNTQYMIKFTIFPKEREFPKVIGDKIWYNAKMFTPCERQTVYNLEVDEDNSYTANNIVVHNCQSFSMSGKMKGMSTVQGEEVYTLDRYLELKSQGFKFEGQSYLFWEYMRILTELRRFNPNIYFFLENVEMLEKWERCLSHAIGVRGVHINSALVSAQNRRIYWSNIKAKDLGNTSLFDFSDDPFELPSLQTDIPQPRDTGVVVKDVLLDDVDGKYYLKDGAVSSLMEKADRKKLKEYFLEPQVSVDEALRYMDGKKDYSHLSKAERLEIATIGYELDKRRLHDNYYGKEKDAFDEVRQEDSWQRCHPELQD